MVETRRNLLQEPVNLSAIEKMLINRLQTDLPLVESPFEVIANELGLSEQQVIETLQNLQKRGVITRFGPLFDITKKSGAFSLCALKVPPERLEQVADLVNSYSQVAHNYLREHQWNMWFVLATRTQQELEETFNEIVSRSECKGINCPKQKEYFVGLNLQV